MDIRTQKVEDYISRFFKARFPDFKYFYQSSFENRRYEIYPLKDGNKIMDFIHWLDGNISESFYLEELVPYKYVSAEALFKALDSFKAYVHEHQTLLDANLNGEDTAYPISYLKHFSEELMQMVEQARQIYDKVEVLMPYQDLRYHLISKNIGEFVKILQSILASVSYAIAKTSEGYHHSNVYLILKMLGFDIVPEETTNRGRIDAVIRFTEVIYVLEIKFTEKDDHSAEALQQIREKGYAEKYYIEKKEVIGIGISFSEELRNINGFVSESLH